MRYSLQVHKNRDAPVAPGAAGHTHHFFSLSPFGGERELFSFGAGVKSRPVARDLLALACHPCVSTVFVLLFDPMNRQ
jgi:hypothetical protein